MGKSTSSYFYISIYSKYACSISIVYCVPLQVAHVNIQLSFWHCHNNWDFPVSLFEDTTKKKVSQAYTYSKERIHPFMFKDPVFSKSKQYIFSESCICMKLIAKNSLIHFSFPFISKFMFAWKPCTSRSMLGPIRSILMLLIVTVLLIPTSITTQGLICCYRITSLRFIKGSNNKPGLVTWICSV